MTADAAALLERMERAGLTLAVAESLTGGSLTDAFVRVPGASRVLLGGLVAYATPLKQRLLGVDAALLAEHGAVHPDVAAAMARGVRTALAVDGRPAEVGLGTTGVAGPGPADGHPAGTVWVAAAVGSRVRVAGDRLDGDRAAVRAAAIGLALTALAELLPE